MDNKNTNKLILCISCFEINYFGDEQCSNCNNQIILNDKVELLEVCDKTVFFAYQNRNTIQRFVDQAEGGPIPKAMHIPYHEIFSFIAMSVLSGLTFEGVRYLAIKLKDSLKRQRITLQSKLNRTDYNPNEELLNTFIEDEEELQKFIKFIEEYKSGMPDVHEEILVETIFLDQKVIEENRLTLNELLKSVEEKMDEEKILIENKKEN